MSKTAAALAAGLTDAARIHALEGIPGFGAGGPFTSVLLTAWNPKRFGVQDKIILHEKWRQTVAPACICDQRYLPTYFDHLRQIADELDRDWTPRRVDMALINL